MSLDGSRVIPTDTAAVALASAFLAVKTYGAAAITTAKTETGLGICQKSTTASETDVPVCIAGPSKAQYDGTGSVNPGDRLMLSSGTNGQLTAHDGLAGSKVFAIAETAASAAGEIFDVIVLADKELAT